MSVSMTTRCHLCKKTLAELSRYHSMEPPRQGGQSYTCTECIAIGKEAGLAVAQIMSMEAQSFRDALDRAQKRKVAEAKNKVVSMADFKKKEKKKKE